MSQKNKNGKSIMKKKDNTKHVLYTGIFENLWRSEKRKAMQTFLDHSNNKSSMFNIPSMWVPIVSTLLKEIVYLDPDICFLQVKEENCKLEIHTKPSNVNQTIIQHIINGASDAIDTLTLAHLRIVNRIQNDTA